MVLLEVCVDQPAGLAAAVAGGADRIELCAELGVGGLTPSAGFMRLAARVGVPVMALIRPRAGGFCYSGDELEVMEADIAKARRFGLAGVVIGAAQGDGQLDRAALARLLKASAGMEVTLNRVFDLAPEPFEALEIACSLGIGRILTSGGAERAQEGIARLTALLGAARGRIGILPAGGIDAINVGSLVERTGVREIHASCSELVPGPLAGFGLERAGARITSAAKVKALKLALAGLA